MSSFDEKINISNFSISKMDLSEIDSLTSRLPRNGVFDLNIAEKVLIITLEGQNLCQEKIVILDRWIGNLEAKKNKAWSFAALTRAKEKGYKTAKDKEWFAQSDDDYILLLNDITMAKASKKWLENKASYFSGWHYAVKTFLRRDYSLENSANLSTVGYTNNVGGGDSLHNSQQDICGEHDWG